MINGNGRLLFQQTCPSMLVGTTKVGTKYVLLRRGWVQEIKRMYPDLLMHGLFLFLT